MREKDSRSQNIWGKHKFDCKWYCRERTEFCTLLQLCAWIRSDEKISRKLWIQFLWRWKQAHVVSSRGTAYLWDKSSSKPTIHGSTRYSQMRTKEERSTNSERCFVQRTSKNRELCMVHKTLEICLAETHASRNREAQTKDLLMQAMLIPAGKKQRKRNETRS